MTFPSLSAGLLWGALVLAGAGCSTEKRVGAAAERELTGEIRQEHVILRYRPNSRTAAAATRVAALAELELARMCARFEVPNDQIYTIYIFDDFDDLHRVTGAAPGFGGFTMGQHAYFVLDDPALTHEMAHAIVGSKVGQPGGQNQFLVEAMAGVAFGPVKLAGMDADSKFALEQNKLPELAELRGPGIFDAWAKAHPDGNLYRFGASWLHFLLEQYGAERLKRYYLTDDTKTAFGESLASLEARWHQWLTDFPLRAEARAALEAMHAKPGPGPITILGNEMFTYPVFVPDNMHFAGDTLQWRKNGRMLPGMTGNVLKLWPAEAADSGVYEMKGTQQKDGRAVGFELELRVIDPAMFLPTAP